jgi:hypothetical protein
MPPADGRHRGDDAYPPVQSWDVSRRPRASVGLVGSGILASLAVHGLVSGDASLVLVALWFAASVTGAIGALTMYRTRVTVDRVGVHVATMVRRRTYPWDDIPVVRPAAASEGRSNVQLVLTGGKVVDLPNVAAEFNVFRRWHDAVRAER